MKMSALIHTLLIIFLVAGCRSNRVAAVDSFEIANPAGSWELMILNDTPVDEFRWHKIPRVNFDESTGNVSGHSGCNNFFGNYRTEGDKISIGPLGSTKMYCEGVPEEKFFEALESATSFRIEEEILYLSGNGQILLQFISKQ